MSGFKLSADKKTLLGYEGNCPEEIVIPNDVEIIEKGAFKGEETLKKVKLHSSVKTIKSEAFARTGIQSVTLPASVQSLAKNAFSYMTMGRQKYGQPYETPSTLKIDKKNPYYFTDDKCLYELKNDELILIFCFKGGCNTVDVANGTVIIKNGAFNHCKYLTSISLPETLTTIEDNAFKGLELYSLKLPAKTTDIGTSDLSYLTDNLSNWNSYYGTGTSWSTKIIVDPENPMYASGDNCFIKKTDGIATVIRVYDKRVDEIIIPDCATHIGPGAFEECAKVKKITLPQGLVEIQENAFKKCSGIEEIEIPSSVKTIAAGAFASCTKLRDVIFKSGDIDIEKGAFEYCKKAQLLFTCPAGSKVETYAKENKINIAGGKEDSNNPASAFSYTVSKAKTVKITGYVSHAEKVIIPDNIEDCPVIAFNKDVFKNNKKITSVVWPASIPVIPKEIFFGCTALKEITIPEGITEISEKAFRNCTSLTTIYIPATVTAIHEKAFECAENTVYGWEYWNCVKTIIGDAKSFAAKFAKTAKIKFVPAGQSADNQEALSAYTYHKVADGIALDDFEITPDMPFTKNPYGENYLLEFEIPNEILGEPVVELSVDFHQSAKKRNSDEVKYEKIAETLIIPQNLKRIRCPLEGRGIKKVVVSPDNKEMIFDNYAWYENGGKTIVSTWLNSNYSWSGGIDHYTIREGTVEACPDVDQKFEIEKLTFPASFTKIHKKFLRTTFSWGRKCTVEKIYANYDSCMREYAEKIEAEFIALDRQDIVFSDDGKTLVSCPQLFAEESYTIPDTVTAIKEFAFKGNEGIKEIVIPDSVIEIGKGAFTECAALETVSISNSVTTLPDMLFADCGKLKNVTFPVSLITIGKKCFANTALENIALPETVEQIGDYAFATTGYGQNGIKAIELPKTVRAIGISVCAGIKEIIVYDSIDPTAKPAKDYYDDMNGFWNSRVGCMGIRQYENYVGGACNSDVYKHTITVKSADDGTVKYKVLMYGKEEARNVYCAMVSSWGKNAEFNFARIDEKFSKLKDAENRLETVLNRLAYPIDLSDEAKEKYFAWLKRNGANIAGEFIEKSDLAGLMSYEQYGILTKSNIQKLIDLATSKKKVEISAYLLEQKSKL